VGRVQPVHQPGEVIQAVEAENRGWARRIGKVLKPVVPRGLDESLAAVDLQLSAAQRQLLDAAN
jgi:hypothetical protein